MKPITTLNNNIVKKIYSNNNSQGAFNLDKKRIYGYASDSLDHLLRFIDNKCWSESCYYGYITKMELNRCMGIVYAEEPFFLDNHNPYRYFVKEDDITFAEPRLREIHTCDELESLGIKLGKPLILGKCIHDSFSGNDYIKDIQKTIVTDINYTEYTNGQYINTITIGALTLKPSELLAYQFKLKTDDFRPLGIGA